ncbi:uncharacterized protein LOC117822965 isoform X2 [Notolabrus celidotus]|uniref:uncharacterized protein LOC117822965 isoform X2 n=1 Tax=Notolabrus celidotus TaxID=1203425 RepID=UPI00148FB7A6|nr:uncharacterized protein LOC117822965 isoform X2 [Notolabrus celidotus]
MELRDRREDPRVSLSAVEGKRRWDIADVMVSTFTEPKALQVALQILRQMDRNEEAKTLESKTKVCVDKGDPTLRRTSKGELELKPSEEALKHAPCRPLQAAQKGVPLVKKKPEEVMAEAKACVLSEGGDPCNEWLLLSKVALQFGQYKGQTFKWLLENDVSYTVYLVAGLQKEKRSSSPQDPLTANKDCLVKYAKAYPEVMKKVRLRSVYKRAKSSYSPGQPPRRRQRRNQGYRRKKKFYG